MTEFKQEIIKLKKSVKIKNLQKNIKKQIEENSSFLWSNNKHCENREEAQKAEKLFANSLIAEISDEVKTIRPTQTGFYVELSYKYYPTMTFTEATDFTTTVEQPNDYAADYDIDISKLTVNNVNLLDGMVILLLKATAEAGKEWQIQLDIDFPLEIPYAFKDRNKKDSVAYFLNYFRNKKPTLSNDILLAQNIQRIEESIPDTNGNATSGGPKRVCIFGLNNLSEKLTVDDSKLSNGTCAALGISELKLADGTHDTFHQGSGNATPDLVDNNGTHFEFKGPKATDFGSANKTKNARYILHLVIEMNKLILVLYENINGKYEKIKFAQVPENSPLYEMINYNKIADECLDNWEEYWK